LREEGDGDDDTESIGREPLCEIGEGVVDLDEGLEKSAWLADKKKKRNKPPFVVVPAIKFELRRLSNGFWEKLLGILVVDVDDFFIICAYRNKQRLA